MDSKKDEQPSVADEINRELYLSPSTMGDSERHPLLDQARRNIAETDYADEAAKDEQRYKHKPKGE